MSSEPVSPRGISRRDVLLGAATVVAAASVAQSAEAQTSSLAGSVPLPSWNDGAAKQSILGFVRATTDQSSPNFIAPEDRIATFDQDGTLWVEHPLYTQAVFAIDRVVALAPQHPEWRTTAPFDAILAGNQAAFAGFTEQDWEAIVGATHSGMSIETFNAIAAQWIATAKHPRYERLYTDLVYQPMLEVLDYFRANSFATYIVTGGGQAFVRSYSSGTYGIPPERVIGSIGGVKYDYIDGKPTLMKLPKLFFNDNNDGKAIGIDLFIGKRPHAAFGNSTGDQQMLEWTGAGSGARLKMLVYHDDPLREYAYGPAGNLPDTSVGTFSTALMTEAQTRGWTVISMKNDWRRIFKFS